MNPRDTPAWKPGFARSRGQLCFKSNTTPGGGGFSDFPHFTGYSNSQSDWCANSNQDYRDGTCTDTKRFTIFVR